MSKYTDLIAQLEAAPSGNSFLDFDIHAALGRADPHMAPHYTTSLDAALTLVPANCELMSWSITKLYGTPSVYKARIGNRGVGGPPTAALAVCIAALKARAAT